MTHWLRRCREVAVAEPGVQVAGIAASLQRQKVLGSDLIREDVRDPLDDLVAGGVAERVVVRLEAVDVDDPDAAPADALLDGQERLDAFHEPVEVEQLRLRIAVRLLGQPGHDLLEVPRDVADRDVLLGELALQPRHLLGKALRQRANRLVLGFLEELALAGEDPFDGAEQLRLVLLLEGQGRPHPFSEVGCRSRRLSRCGVDARIPGALELWQAHVLTVLNQGMCRSV